MTEEEFRTTARAMVDGLSADVRQRIKGGFIQLFDAFGDAVKILPDAYRPTNLDEADRLKAHFDRIVKDEVR